MTNAYTHTHSQATSQAQEQDTEVTDTEVVENEQPQEQETTVTEGKQAQKQKTAVVEDKQAQEQKTAVVEWSWGEGSEETMHPFWVVRRLTQKQLEQERINQPLGQIKKRFNCKLQTLSVSAVNIATVKGKCLNLTRILHVPFLTNQFALQKDEELILEINEPTCKEKKKTKRSWINAMKEAESQMKEEEKKQKQKKAKSEETS